MTITVSVPDELAAEAFARGLSVEALVEQLAQRAVGREVERSYTPLGPGRLTPEKAADEIRELRKGVTLAGLHVKDLISEGRKY